MKRVFRDILLASVGFAAGAYFMHIRMRDEYQKFADAQIEDVRNHYNERQKKTDQLIEEEAQKKYLEYVSGPYRQGEDPEKPDREELVPLEIIEPDEFGGIDEYETSFLTYYADGILAYDSDGTTIDDIQKVIGSEALSALGKFMPDAIHVRNHNYRKDFEVLKVTSRYRNLYPGDAEEEDYED